MNKKKISRIIAGALAANVALTTVSDNSKVVSAIELLDSSEATDGSEGSIDSNSSNENLSHISNSGVSTEQMKKDFESVANDYINDSSYSEGSVSLLSEEGVNLDSIDHVDLSSMKYDSLSYLQWNKVFVNSTASGSNLELLVDGVNKTFTNGLGVSSDAKIVFDIGAYTSKFTKLIGYIGVDYRQKNMTNADGVDFSIEVSNDGVTWKEVRDIGVIKASEEAYKLSVNVSGIKYIRLNALCGPNNNRSYDHAAFADIKLVEPSYQFETENENSVLFSFSGDNANSIVIDSLVDKSEISYSLDGGSNWITPSKIENLDFNFRSIKLSDSELNSLNQDNDIKVRLGSKVYNIDLKSTAAPNQSTIYGNDLEDRLIGKIDNLEYRVVGESVWQDYNDKVKFEGDKEVEVRYKANGTNMSSSIIKYKFTESKDTAKRTYVPLSEVSLYDFCSEQNNGYSYAKNMLDGNANTLWHNNWNGEDNLYYTVQFNAVKYISSIEYLPNTGVNGRLKSGEILVSFDGTNWESAGFFKGLKDSSELQTINIDNPVPARYLKIRATETYGSTQNRFFTGRMLNFYEDTTKSTEAEPFIKYSTLDKTNNYVLATLVLNEGYSATVKSHKFTTNGEFEFSYTNPKGEVKTIKAVVNNIERDDTLNSVYLSDLQYEESSSFAGWNGIRNDLSPIGGTIGLIVDGLNTSFKRGIGAHANSEVVYDIEAFSKNYDKFSTYVGVDSSRNNNGTVKFTILASKDGKVWDTLDTSDVLTGSSNAKYVEVNIKDYVYLKIKADGCGSTSEDHAVYGNARLLKAGYDSSSEVYRGFKTLEQYDSEISARTVEDNFKNNKKQILEREFVNRVGYGNILSASRDVDGVYDALAWIQSDYEALQLFIEAGDFFSGTGYNALVALGKLYKEFKADMDKLQYKKMLLATAAAYSKDLIPFANNYGGNYLGANPVETYRNFKKLYDDGKFVRQSEFENYHMELVRAVMDSRINYDEIIWLRDYIEKKYPNKSTWQRYNGYGFAAYAYGAYSAAKFYDEANKATWDDKYGFLDYGISYGDPLLYRVWMVMEAGAICWGLSGLGMTLNEVQGIPAIGTFQPGHEAYMLYSVNSSGKGIWSMSDDISGWEASFSRWYNMTKIEHRLLLSWGQKEYNVLNNSGTGNNTSYMMLAQDALNNYDNGYSESMFYNLIANSYEVDSEEHKEALEKSLECYDKNLDSIYSLYKTYLSDTSTTDEDWIKFAEMISEKYKYFPVPMTDLLNLIKKQVKDDISEIAIDILETESLKAASVATSAESLQDSVCRKVANSLLGKVNTDLATFSFDGENANTILINDTYADSTIQVRVSLDGGQTWEKFEDGQTITTSHAIKLTDEQVSRITADKDILVGLMGTPKNFTIDIKEGATITNDLLYKNDLENKLIGDLYGLQYSEDGGSTWNDFTNDTTFPSTSDRVVLVRYRAKGHYLASKSVQYTFKADRDTPTRKYITIDHLSLHSFSTEVSSDKAANIIDGNGNTGWHANGSQEETLADPRYVVIKLDEVKYISAIEYFSSYNNGKVKLATVYTSLDGINWVEAGKSNTWANTSATKSLDLEESSPARYIKFVGTETYGSPIISCRILDLFEDTTKTYKADAKIEYEEVNDTVIAKLVLPNGCKVIGESERVFTSNGTFEFKFTDANDKEQSITAKVDSFEESLPTMEYEFDNSKLTNKDVTLTITSFSKEGVNLISVDENPSFDTEGNYLVKDGNDSTNNVLPNTYVFTENKTVVFILEDGYGVRNYIPVTVDWIDREAPKVSIEYSTQDPTYDSVIATLVGVKEGERVTSVGGETHVFDKNGEFEFVVEDEAGNVAKVTAKVTWIKEKNTDDSENGSGDNAGDNTGSGSEDNTGNDSGNGSDSNVDDNTGDNTGGGSSNGDSSDNTGNGSVEDDNESDDNVSSGDDSNGSSDGTTSEKDPNIDQDFTVEDNRDFEVEFNINSITNKDVTATLVGLDVNDEVISEGGASHTFTKNGEFKFVIKDVHGNTFEKVVEVNWIDKEAPVANIVFDYSKAEEGKVIARLSDPSEDITILNEDKLDYHEFIDNGSYTFKFVDKAGNLGEAVANVDWFKFEQIENVVNYKDIVEGNVEEGSDVKPDYVIASISVDPEKVEILNNEGSNEVKFIKNGIFAFRARMIDSDYEFYIMVKVDWLEETAEEGESPIVPPVSDEDDSTNDGNLGGDNSTDENNPVVPPVVDGDESNEEDPVTPPVVDEGDSDKDNSGDNSTDENNPVVPPVIDGDDSNKDDTVTPPIIDEDGSNSGDISDDSNEQNPVEDGENDSNNGSDNGTVAPPVTTPPVTNPDNGNTGNGGNGNTGSGSGSGSGSGGNGSGSGSAGNSGNGASGNGDDDDNTGNSLDNPIINDSNTGSVNNGSNVEVDYSNNNSTENLNNGSSNIGLNDNDFTSNNLNSNNNYLASSGSYSEGVEDSDFNKESNTNSIDEESKKDVENNSSKDSTNNENSSKDSVKEENSKEDKGNSGVIATVIALTTASASALFVWFRRLFGIKK